MSYDSFRMLFILFAGVRKTSAKHFEEVRQDVNRIDFTRQIFSLHFLKLKFYAFASSRVHGELI